MIEDSGMGEEEVKEAGTLGQLQGVPTLVAQQGCNVDGKVLNILKYKNIYLKKLWQGKSKMGKI